MKKLLHELFYIPKYGKMSEKAFMSHISLSIVGIVLCLSTMALTAYAYFAWSFSSPTHTLQAGYYDCEVNIDPIPDGQQTIAEEDTSIAPVNGAYELNAGMYSVSIKQSEASTASTGFCVIEVNDMVYHTVQIDKEENIEVVFKLRLDAAAKVKVIPHLGTSVYFAAEEGAENIDAYIENGETVMANTSDNYIHISFDDVTHCLNNLNNAEYDSLYDEPFFAWLKCLHEEYGAKFSLYTYLDVLENVPKDKYAADFAAASDWLKIGLHADSSTSTYELANYEQGKAAWNSFVTHMERIGATDNIDRMPRLHYFAGNLEALKGMMDADCGALGFLGADSKGRISYYLNETQSANLYANDHLTDRNNGLVFLTTDMRGDWFKDGFSSDYSVKKTVYDELMYRFDTEEKLEKLDSYIFFSHEWQFYTGSDWIGDGKSWTEDICKFAVEKKIFFDYPQNRNYPAEEIDIPIPEPSVEDQTPGSSNESSSGETTKPTDPTVETTLRDNETVTIVTDIYSMDYVLGSFGGASDMTANDTTGRAISRYFVLKVQGGEYLELQQNLENTELYFAIKEFTDIPLNSENVNQKGQKYETWLSESVTLHEDTRYIVIGFRNGDGAADFTSDQLKKLHECLKIGVVMESGDTLYSIELKYGISRVDLKAYNGINDVKSLAVDTVIYFPPEGWQIPTTPSDTTGE